MENKINNETTLNEKQLEKAAGGTGGANTTDCWKTIDPLPELGKGAAGCGKCKDADGNPVVLEFETAAPVSEISGHPWGYFFHCDTCNSQYLKTDYGTWYIRV